LSLALRRWGVAQADALPLSELVISAVQGAILLAKVRRDTTVIYSIARQLASQISRSIETERQ